MDALEAVGDPVRRRFVEALAAGRRTAGELAALAASEFGITQPAASRHLRVLRDTGLVTSQAEGQRRVYELDPETLQAAAAWFDGLDAFWEQRLDALGTELVRARREGRSEVHNARTSTPTTTGDTKKVAS